MKTYTLHQTEQAARAELDYQRRTGRLGYAMKLCEGRWECVSWGA